MVSSSSMSRFLSNAQSTNWEKSTWQVAGSLYYSNIIIIMINDNLTWSPSFPTIASNSASKSCTGPTHCIKCENQNVLFRFFQTYPLYGVLHIGWSELLTRGKYKASTRKLQLYWNLKQQVAFFQKMDLWPIIVFLATQVSVLMRLNYEKFLLKPDSNTWFISSLYWFQVLDSSLVWFL